jgi:hypothetical protein
LPTAPDRSVTLELSVEVVVFVFQPESDTDLSIRL